MKRLMATGLLFAAWTASVPAEAMSLGVRMALWGTAPAQRQASGGNLADAVEAHGLTFETGGDAAWFVQSDVAHDGATALRSGAIGDDGESWVETTVTDAGTVTFWWKASSEVYKKTPIDFVAFSVDGGERARLGGETAWTNMMFDVSGSGRHVLRWTYSKDMMDVAGEDCAWLDCVTWTPAGVRVDMGGGKSVTVPAAWLDTISERIEAAGGNAAAALQATAANGRLSVAECYVLGVDPEAATNDFKITAFPMKADGTPDLANIVLEPPQARWNVPATWKVKGAATLEGPWGEVPAGGEPTYRFFKVEVVLP